MVVAFPCGIATEIIAPEGNPSPSMSLATGLFLMQGYAEVYEAVCMMSEWMEDLPCSASVVIL